MDQLIGNLGEVGIFVMLVIMAFTQFAKMFLESKKQPPTDETMSKTVQAMTESYRDLLETLDGYFKHTEEEMSARGDKIDALYEMHNIRRNGSYAWYPWDPAPLQQAIEKLAARMVQREDDQLKALNEILRCQERIAERLKG